MIVYGVEESNSKDLPERVSSILLASGEKPVVTSTVAKMGSKRAYRYIRPIKFTLSSSGVVSQVLRKAKLLRSKEGFKSVHMCPDRTIEKRRAYKILLEELKLKSKAEPNDSFVIRNNKMVMVRTVLRPLGMTLDLFFTGRKSLLVLSSHSTLFVFFFDVGPFNCVHGFFCVHPCLVSLRNIGTLRTFLPFHFMR